jgi:bifunctional non-homologous end joining protein LigD
VAFQRKKPAAIGVKAPYPGFIEPKLATSIDKVPSGERWIQTLSGLIAVLETPGFGPGH